MRADLADFMLANMKNSHAGPNGAGPIAGYSGAVIRADALYIATLDRNSSGRLQLRREWTRQFELQQRTQGRLRPVYQGVRKFIRDAGIRRVLLRNTSDSRKFAASAEGYALECALKLVPGLLVDVVHRATIDAWSKQERYLLPYPPVGPWKWSDGFKAAIEVAAFLEARCSCPRDPEYGVS